MEYKQRAKMPAFQRAKQFMPFAAVKGLEKAIAEQDQRLNRVDEVELGEEQVTKITETLKYLKKGDMVSVCFYINQQYMTLQGVVEQVTLTLGLIRVAGTMIATKTIKKLNYTIR